MTTHEALLIYRNNGIKAELPRFTGDHYRVGLANCNRYHFLAQAQTLPRPAILF